MFTAIRTIEPRIARRRRAGRTGWTLIEMLVSLGVIAVLVALVVPAVLSGRASSQRAKCRDHLRQIGLSLQSFETVHLRFPPVMPGENPLLPGRRGANWIGVFAHLLPHMEQRELGNRIDFKSWNQPPWDTASMSPSSPAWLREAVHAPLHLLRCPADRPGEPGRPGVNYRACLGASPMFFNDGAFVPVKPVTAAEIRDGLSNTIAMAERVVGSYDPVRFNPKRDVWYSGLSAVRTGRIDAEEMFAACASLTGSPLYYHPYSGATWFYSGYEYTCYNHVASPNPGVPDCSSAPPPVPPTSQSLSLVHPSMISARSMHSGGVHVLYCDGRVEFTSDYIDLFAWRALATRASADASP